MWLLGRVSGHSFLVKLDGLSAWKGVVYPGFCKESYVERPHPNQTIKYKTLGVTERTVELDYARVNRQGR